MLSASIERLRNVLIALRASLWLIPAGLSIGAVLLARGLVTWEREGRLGRIDAWWFFTADAETARELLSTLLSAMINMTSLVISVTMVVLTLAASQLGPRLIWNFLRDREIQAVLGTFFATIFFILVVIRSIAEPNPPLVAVTVASGLVGLCLFALLFHVNKVSRAIIADTVLDEVAGELRGAFEGLRPAEADDQPETMAEADLQAWSRMQVRQATASRSGYVQVVEYGALVRHAEAHDLFIDLCRRAGHYVLAGQPLAALHGRTAVSGDLAAAVADAVVIGNQRTPTQDLEYSVRELVEIAVRALSPGINDPYTAIGALHQLGGALAILFGRKLRPALHRDASGTVRVRTDVSTCRGIVDAAFAQIRQHAAARADVAVLIALAEVIGKLAATDPPDEAASALRRQLSILARSGGQAIRDEADRADFAEVCRQASDGFPATDTAETDRPDPTDDRRAARATDLGEAR